jgi:hypothetical protein
MTKHRHIITVSMLLAFCFAFIHTFAQQKKLYYVALEGSDQNKGSLEQPFATIQQALETVKQDKPIEAAIVLREGTYFIEEGILIDSSFTASTKLDIQNYKDEKVTLSGGIKLDSKKFKKVGDVNILSRLSTESQNNVLEIDLSEQGVIVSGNYQQHGFKSIEIAPLEVFFNEQPLTLVRWPNDKTISIGKVLDPGSIERNGDKTNRGAIFQYDFELPNQWKDVKNIWLNGVFAHGYADENLQVKNIDTENHTIELTKSSHYGVKSTREDGEIKNYRRFYFYNVLEELDSPGEWFIDYASKKLYLWPPYNFNEGELFVSQTKEPLLSLHNTHNVTVSGIDFAYGRGMAIYAEATMNTTIIACKLMNFGTVAISMNNPLTPNRKDYTRSSKDDENLSNINFIIKSCKIFNTGTGGIILAGGNRKNLTPSNNKVKNCEIGSFSRRNYFSCPAISICGVGQKVTNCFIHDSKGQAIMYSGNDHEIAFNHFTKVVTEISDQGAVYTGRDPSSTGTVIHDNFFDNVKSDFGYSATAVYIDDRSGGIRVLNNIFYNSGSSGEFSFGAVHINGGGNNSLENNYFIYCEKGISMNVWSASKWTQYINDKDILKKITQDVDVRSGLYVTRYPYLKNILDPKNESQRVNDVSNSLVFRVGQFITKPDFIIERNTYFAKSDPGFLNLEKKQFELVKSPAQLQKNTKWRPVQFDKIGLIKSN